MEQGQHFEADAQIQDAYVEAMVQTLTLIEERMLEALAHKVATGHTMQLTFTITLEDRGLSLSGTSECLEQARASQKVGLN